jgi:SNF2 family DNA or RNA helicase
MKSVEDQADQDVSFCTALRWRGSKVYFDFANRQLVSPAYLKNFIFKERIKGGILGDEVGLGKTFEVLGLVLASPPKEKLDPHPTLIESRATLVLCPNHLSKQWQDEIARATNLKVHVINTIVQLRALTYEQVRSEYDVILCVYQLFETPHYCALPSTHTAKAFDAAQIDWEKRNKQVDNALKPIKKSKSYNTSCPILDHFYWHRVVIDEGHDVISVTPHGDFIARLQGRFKWYVTATPFAHYRCLEGIKEFIGCELAGDRGQLEFQTELVLKDYFWRNTKESVKNELTIPDTVDEVKFVNFSTIERAIYMSMYDVNEYAQLETCSFNRSGKDLREQMVAHINNLTYNIPRLESSIETQNNELTVLKNYYDNRQLGEEEKRRLKRDIKWKESMLDKHRKSLNVARNVLKILEEERASYDARINDKGLTASKREYLRLQEKHGTKLTEMILYLKNLLQEKPESRVIMFSQFDVTLTETAAILKEHGIKSTFVAGNVYKKTKAIEDFKNAEEDIKVIMLSLDKTAAGTNLIAATHIILLDPVRGSKQEAQAVELQAIGRAHRQGQTKQIYIVRFVVRNSIDHRVYLRNNNLPTDSCVEYDPETYRPSETTTQGRAATLTKSGSFSALTMDDLKRSQEIINNTNEKEQPKKKKATPKKKTIEKKNNNNDEDEDIIQEDSE